MLKRDRIRRTLVLFLAAAAVCASLCFAYGCGNSSGAESASGSDIPASESDTVGSENGPAYPEYVSVTDEQSECKLELSAESGVYADEMGLEVRCSDSEAVIFYTTDGSDPRTSSTRMIYEGPIHLDDREGDPNVISATPVIEFDAANNKRDKDGTGYYSKVGQPDDEDVDKCNVIKLAALDSNGAYTDVITETYFVGDIESHVEGIAKSCKASGTALTVISISMEYDDLFGHENGIYTKGIHFENAVNAQIAEKGFVDGDARGLDANYKQRGRAWEREAHVDIFECTPSLSECVLSQDCGIRVQGNYSRSDLQKGFRLYARSDYGENNFDYPIFGEDFTNEAGEVMDKFKTLILRNGGNCAFTTKYNDTFWQSLVGHLDVSTQKSRPCVVYLNGEYWGLYILQEDYSDDYFEDTYGVEKNDVVLYKGDAETYAIGYKLDVGDLPDGEDDVSYYFGELLDFFASHRDLKSDEDYAEFCKLVDPESARDYYAVELWINNKWDWPGKNWSMWKTLTVDENNPYGDGRWRFCFYDLEFGGVSGRNDAYTNTIKEDNYKEFGMLDMGTSNPSVLVFTYLMTNEGFRNDFYAKILSLSENEFEYEYAVERLDLFNDTYSPLFEQFFRRYDDYTTTDGAVYGGYASYLCIKEFLSERANHIQTMIDWSEKYFETH